MGKEESFAVELSEAVWSVPEVDVLAVEKGKVAAKARRRAKVDVEGSVMGVELANGYVIFLFLWTGSHLSGELACPLRRCAISFPETSTTPSDTDCRSGVACSFDTGCRSGDGSVCSVEIFILLTTRSTGIVAL
jgi:hypothetical protein